MNAETVEGIVRGQIGYPREQHHARRPRQGDNARDVAAYVGQVAGIPARTRAQLAAVGQGGRQAVEAKNGTSRSRPTRRARSRSAVEGDGSPGPIEFVRTNPSPIQHNIALKGGEEGDSSVTAAPRSSRPT